MKRSLWSNVSFLIMGMLLLLTPTITQAADEQVKPAKPPLAQQLVREGDLAVKLQSALALGKAKDEAEAESRLGEAGISPRNGWIADYPVTPDIVAEVQESVSKAADNKKISMSKDEALRNFNNIVAEADLKIKPYTAGKKPEATYSEPLEYPDQTVINDYYAAEGPPVVTYYTPPPDYYYLYVWVPYPFWWFDFWCPGFFVLRDFHRTVFVDGRVFFISNHFNDFRTHRVFRVDPIERFRGRTFAGIGVTNRKAFIPTGVSRSNERTIFNGTRTRMTPSGRMGITPGGGRMSVSPPSGGGRGGHR